MENFKENIRDILIYYFQRGRKQLKQGKSCVKFTAWISSKNVKANGSLDSVVEDAHRTGKHSEIDDNKIKAWVQENINSTL